jgi:alkanesulfonate monooxygenase SsuD/methylene tetrahydromethanopterin reductase-like flavin-dependent oxidoreductase (luciferase family)
VTRGGLSGPVTVVAVTCEFWMHGFPVPVTRHPAVVASAMASLQVESGGRAVFGLGRGDSSLSQLGISATTTDQLALLDQTNVALARDVLPVVRRGTES